MPLCPVCGVPVEGLASTAENASLDPTSVYGISKLAQELLVLRMKDVYPTDVSVLRFFNAIGPGQSLSNPYMGVLGVFVNRARENKTIDLYEDGEILRDFVHVGDVVEALVRALDCPVVPVCNIGSGWAVSIRHLAQKIVNLLGSESRLEVTGKGRVGDIRGLEADISTAARFLGWKPTISLDEGLRCFIEWAASQVYDDGYEHSLLEFETRGLYR